MSLFVKKSLEQLLSTADDAKGLKRTLGATNLVALGIGAIIGAGLFVRTAAAAGGGQMNRLYSRDIFLDDVVERYLMKRLTNRYN